MASTTPQPRIPERFLDVPSQRLYILSFGLLCQVRIHSVYVGIHTIGVLLCHILRVISHPRCDFIYAILTR